MSDWEVRQGDCLALMADMEPGSVDAIVTDPPYGLSFMGAGWDHAVPGVAFWAEALRVAKPGAHLLAFGGTRTFHRLAVAIEDAGWEIRDTLSWLYSQGFPKSLNVSADPRFCSCSAVPYSHGDDNLPGVREPVSSIPADDQEGENPDLFTEVQRGTQGGRLGETRLQGGLGEDSGELRIGKSEDAGREESCVEGWGDVLQDARKLHGREVRAVPAGLSGDGPRRRIRDGAPAGDGPSDRAAAGTDGSGSPSGSLPVQQLPRESGTVADQWEPQDGGAWPTCDRCGLPVVPKGIGTALKPSWEPIILARKPFPGTVAQNVLAHGTGALNIDGCRIETNETIAPFGAPRKSSGGILNKTEIRDPEDYQQHTLGRWPANVCLDECAAAELDRQSGELAAGSRPANRAGIGYHEHGSGTTGEMQRMDSGGASRFFYVAKPDRAERDMGIHVALKAGGSNVAGVARDVAAGLDRNRPVLNNHPTVKPVALMRWLCRLVMPPGGLVLDPFCGSGTTGVAAVGEGFRFVGMELEPRFVEISRARLANTQAPLFDLAGTVAP